MDFGALAFCPQMFHRYNARMPSIPLSRDLPSAQRPSRELLDIIEAREIDHNRLAIDMLTITFRNNLHMMGIIVNPQGGYIHLVYKDIQGTRKGLFLTLCDAHDRCSVRGWRADIDLAVRVSKHEPYEEVLRKLEICIRV